MILNLHPLLGLQALVIRFEGIKLVPQLFVQPALIGELSLGERALHGIQALYDCIDLEAALSVNHSHQLLWGRLDLLLIFLYITLAKRSDLLNDRYVLALGDLVIDMVLVIGILVLPLPQEHRVKASSPRLL